MPDRLRFLLPDAQHRQQELRHKIRHSPLPAASEFPVLRRLTHQKRPHNRFCNIIPSLRSQLIQNCFMPLERFLDAQLCIISVKTRLTKIFYILLHLGPPFWFHYKVKRIFPSMIRITLNSGNIRSFIARRYFHLEQQPLPLLYSFFCSNCSQSD